MTTLLAFDTGTERMSIALRHGGQTWSRNAEGGARASATLLPEILVLLAAAGLTPAGLDAIAFGRGPGAFTGLRTACAVAQGLALGSGRPVLPIDSLLMLAETARNAHGCGRVWASIDARMGQIYAAEYAWAGGRWRTAVAPFLTDAEALSAHWRAEPPECVAGNALAMFAGRLQTGAARAMPEAGADALALLSLAEAAWRVGEAVDAALALPLYVRDKVAETSAERAARAALASAGANAP